MKIVHMAVGAVVIVPYGWAAVPLSLLYAEGDGRKKRLTKPQKMEQQQQMVGMVMWTIFSKNLKDALITKNANVWEGIKDWNQVYLAKHIADPIVQPRHVLFESFVDLA